MQDWTETHQEKVTVPIVKENIPANTIITEDYLTMGEILEVTSDPQAVKNIQDAIGKLAITELVAGEQIKRDKLASPDILLQPGEAFVCVKTDNPEQVLAGKLRTNTVVNVQWRAGEDSPPQILAEKAQVISLLDENLQPINMGGVVQTATQSNASATGNKNVTKAVQTALQSSAKLSMPKYILLKVKERESYDFDRPLHGGAVMLVQVSDGKAIPTTPQPTVQNETQTTTQDQQQTQQPTVESNQSSAAPIPQ